MPDTLSALEDELRARLNQIELQLRPVEGLMAERARIQGALERLYTIAPTANPTASGVRPRRPAAKPPAAKSPASGRPRGSARVAILRVIEERPGVSVAEIAGVARLPKPTVHNTIGRLRSEGLVEKATNVGSVAGWQLPRGTGDQSLAPSAPMSLPD